MNPRLILVMLLTVLMSGVAIASQGVFQHESWPYEGMPYFEVIRDKIELHESTSSQSPIVATIDVDKGSVMTFKFGVAWLIERRRESGEIFGIKNTAKISTDLILGKSIQITIKPGILRACADGKSEDINEDFSFKKGDAIENLAYIGEGGCVYRQAGKLFNIICLDSQIANGSLVQESQPVTEWWVSVVKKGHTLGWLKIDDSSPLRNAAIRQRVEPPLAAGTAACAETKQSPNDIGYRQYKNGYYRDSIKWFEEALKENPDNATAHYNLACALNRLNEEGKNPGDNDLVKQSLTHLRTSIALSPSQKKRALEDEALKSVRNTVYFRILAGMLDLGSTAEVKRVLNETYWTSDNDCGGGLFNDNLGFRASGEVLGGCNSFCIGKEENCIIASGYQVKGTTITLTAPRTPVISLGFKFDGVEAHVLGFDKDGRKVNEWHEFSGYHGSP